jgi:hypothetical protein
LLFQLFLSTAADGGESLDAILLSCRSLETLAVEPDMLTPMTVRLLGR